MDFIETFSVSRPLLGRFGFTHRRCPAVVPEKHLPVQETGGLLEDPGLVGVDPHLDLSSLRHPAAWSTLA